MLQNNHSLVFLASFSFLKFLTWIMYVDLQEEKIDSSLEFLILASDGLWDVVSNEVRHDFHLLLLLCTSLVTDRLY